MTGPRAVNELGGPVIPGSRRRLIGNDSDTHTYIPADTIRFVNVGLTLVRHRRRCANVKPTLVPRLVTAVMHFIGLFFRRIRTC